MKSSFVNIVNKYAVKKNKGEFLTFFPEKESWTVDIGNISDFICEYLESVENGGNSTLCLAERSTSVMPAIADFVFKFQNEEQKEDWEPFTDVLIHWLIHCYQTVLEDKFDIKDNKNPENPYQLACLVLEASEYQEAETSFVVYRVRLQFPFCRIKVSDQLTVLKPEVIRLLRSNHVLSKFMTSPIGDWNEIIDTTSLTNYLTYYMSVDRNGLPPLIYKTTYEKIILEEIEDGTVDESEMILPVENHSYFQNKQISLDLINEKGNEFFFPLIFSIEYFKITTLLKTQNSHKRSESTVNFNLSDDEIDGGENKIADIFLKMIKAGTFTGNEITWLTIGKSLHKIYRGEDLGLQVWLKYTHMALSTESAAESSSVPDFMIHKDTIETTCLYHYNSFTKVYYTIKTLAWLAHEDSPEMYLQWHKKWVKLTIDEALTATHADVAKCLYRFTWLHHVFSAESGKWYTFNGHHWKPDNGALEIQRKMTRDFLKIFERYRAEKAVEAAESESTKIKNAIESDIKRVENLIKLLKSDTYSKSLVSSLKKEFAIDDVESIFDDNLNLLGVENGVLEVSGGRIYHRGGRPEDYISRHTTVAYNSKFRMDHPQVKQIMEWLRKTFIEDDLIEHFLKFSASILRGGNRDKIFFIFTGAKGDNSKSTIIKLFEITLGPYCFKIDPKVFGKKKGGASGPSPEIARSKNTRIAFIEEPGGQGKFDKDDLKRWTGGDSFFARMLMSNGGEIKSSFKAVIVCNDPPEFENPDQALKNRTRMLPFDSRFLKSGYPDTEEEQYAKRLFPADTLFEEKLPYLAKAFLWLICHYYPLYAAKGLKDPVSVERATEKYWRENDMYAEFIGDKFEKADKEKYRISIDDIYNEFKDWYEVTYPGEPMVNKKELKKQFVSRLGDPEDNKYWRGLKLAREKEKGGGLTQGLKSLKKVIVN